MLSFVNGFQNSVNSSETFTLLASNFNFSGVFSNVASGSRLSTSDGSGSFIVTYSGGNLVLSNFLGGNGLVTSTWDGSTGNWSSAPHWSPHIVPNDGNNGSTFNAILGSGDLTQDISGGVTIEQLQMSGGTLHLAQPLTLNDGLQFSGGAIDGGTLSIAGVSSQSATMTTSGLTINNSGTYNITLNGNSVFSGTPIFNNSGTLAKQPGTELTTSTEH